MFDLKRFKSGMSPVVVLFLLMTTMTFLGGCGGGGDGETLQAGDEFVASFTDSSGEHSLVYRAFDLASGDEEPVVVLLEVSGDLEGASGLRASGAPRLETIDQWQAWLDEHWDPYIGTDDDPGIDAAEFVAYLKERGLSGEAFVNLYETSGFLTMEEFMAFAEDVAVAIDDDDPLSDLEWFLDQFQSIELFSQDISMDLGVFLDKLDVAYPEEGYSAFLDWMIEEELDFQGLYGLYFEYLWELQNEADPDPSLQNFDAFLEELTSGRLSVTAKNGDDDKKKPSGLDVAKFAWDVIKDGKPKTDIQGAYTSVLAEEDKSPLNYAYAQDDSTSNVSFRLENLFGMALVEASYKGECTYAAVHSIYGGRYLPNVHFKVNKSYAFWSWNLDVSAQVSNVSNKGSFEDPDPVIDMEVNLRAGSLLQDFTRSTTFRARGTWGIRIVD